MRNLLGIALVCIGVSASASGQIRPLCSVCDSGKTILTRFQPPDGYARAVADPGSFADWLCQLPLLPPSADALDWRGNRAMAADEVAGVLDWRLLGSVEQCADVAVRLIAEYARGNGSGDGIAFRSLSGQDIGWAQWRTGRYEVNDRQTEIVFRRGAARLDTSEEFDDYLVFVMSYVNTASLHRDWPKVGFEEIEIGDVLIQPSPSVKGLGHLSIVVDACTTSTGARLYLFTDGFTPARAPVVRRRVPGDPASVWMTPEDYLELMDQFGAGEFHRPPNWFTNTTP